MAIDWDPTTGIVGLDVLPTRNGGVRLDHAQRAVGIFVPSTAAEASWSAFSTYVDRKSADDPTVICEVYDPSTTVFGSSTTSTFAPNEDVTFSATAGTLIGSPTDTVGNRYTNIDETTPSDADFIRHTSASSSVATVAVRVASTGGLGAGNQVVTNVKVKTRMGISIAAAAGVTTTVKLTIGGVDYAPEGGGVVAFGTGIVAPTNYEHNWPVNPATNLPWTEAEVQALDSTSSVKVTTTWGATAGARWELYYLAVEVAHYDDPRLGFGSATVTATGWTTWTFGAPFSKAAATDYLITLRRTSTSGWCVIPTFDTGDFVGFGHGTYEPTLTAAGQPDSLGDFLTPVAPAVLTITGPAASVDSQPYVSARFENVDTSATILQEITPGSTETIGWIRTVARATDLTGPQAPLLAKIKRRSDNVQMGGTVTFNEDLVEDDPLTFVAIDDTMASTVSLVSGTQYYIELSCTAPAGFGWQVPVFATKTPPLSANARGFGGTTDRATIATVESDNNDAPIVWGTVPAAPANFTATANTAGVGSIDLTWTATALGADFDRYEIDLKIGTTWHRVANVNVEATAAHSDYNRRQGAAEDYRIMVRKTNGTRSLPSATSTATLTKTGTYLLAPEAPSVNRAAELDLGLGFDTPQDRVEELRYGRRYPTVTKAPEDRGVTLTGSIEAEGTAGFIASSEWMRSIGADVTQLVLVNGFGERWFVDVQFQAGAVGFTTGDTGDWQTRAVRFVEINDRPAPVEVT